MIIRFYFDPESDLPHIYRHNVTENEVKEVLLASGEDRPGNDDSRIAIGQTQSGRYLRVIYVPEQNGKDLFVITAYELKGKALMAYRRRHKRKQR